MDPSRVGLGTERLFLALAVAACCGLLMPRAQVATFWPFRLGRVA
jgi:hypothetical protein